MPSAEKGLLGDVRNLVLAGDSTPVRSGASPYGKRICGCKEKGIKSCQCPRAYSDPDASWGWDSYRDRWFYGRHLYEWTAADSPYDLPVYFRLVTGRRHDSVSCVVSLDECQRGITLNTEAIPLCPAGHAMCYDGFCKGRGRHKWRCPLKRAHTAKQIQCPGPCSESAYGGVLYTYHDDNLRFFPRIARGTEAWKTVYAKRTSVERSNKRKKIDYRLEATRGRSTVAWNWRSMLTAMCQHVDGWYAASGCKSRDLVNAWLPVLASAA